MSDPGGLVLAAGAGSRFGMPKALVELEGELLVDRAVRTLRSGGCRPVAVVLGARADEVVHRARLTAATVVTNPAWERGLASSLRCGLDALAAAAAPAAVIALVDQPGVTAEAVIRLIRRWKAGAPVAVATYDGRRRNPVLLDATVWQAVTDVATGDTGARAWLERAPVEVAEVPCEDVSSPRDIDVVADLASFTAKDRLEDKR